MYSFEWDEETGGYVLNISPMQVSPEPRPVYYRELDILGFDRYWNYPKSDEAPLLWATANAYIYRGKTVAKTMGGSLYKAPDLNLLADPEPNGGKLRFVDIPAMVRKNDDIMEALVQETIKKIYNTYIKYQNKVDVFYVAFSGGKDSVVALDLVSRALPHNAFKVLFGDTKMEFPDTYEAVKKVKTLCEEKNIEFLTSRSDLEPEDTWKQFGPPAQRIRWCCSVHKSAPQVLLLREYLNNSHFRGMAFTGVRGDESESRSEYDELNLGEKIKGQYSYHTILHWNSAELYLYIYKNNLILNDTYKKGNSRAGCLVCPYATNKNIFFKEKCYSQALDADNYRTTTTFNQIILDTTAKDLSDEKAVREFMNIAGWKARRSGRELKNVSRHIIEKKENDIFYIELLVVRSSWREWIKTIGAVEYLDDYDLIIQYQGSYYRVKVVERDLSTVFQIKIKSHTRTDIFFMAAIRAVLKKASYCVACRVCEANCPYGYITFDNGRVRVDNKCIKCGKCREIDDGCLVANSLRLPIKEENTMGSIDRYTNFGVEAAWLKIYFDKKDSFWSDNDLGSKMVECFNKFLSDADVSKKKKITEFGELVTSMGIASEQAWGLMLCNLVYTAEFNWWVKNVKHGIIYTPDTISVMLGSNMTENTRSHIVSAYRNTFISNAILGTMGFACCDYEIKNKKRIWHTVSRAPWKAPDDKVILYALYKFSEACGGYKQFTLTRLLNHEIDSDGVSPTEIFGLGRETMERVLQGLAANYPEYISVSFTHDLDNINLKEKKSADVLKLF